MNVSCLKKSVFFMIYTFFFSYPLLAESEQKAHSLKIQSSDSQLLWEGKKRHLNMSHDGSVKIKSGTVSLKDGQPSEAEVIVDMTSIINFDQKEEKYNKMLVDHLSSDDFFYVEKFPEAKVHLKEFKKESDGSWLAHGDLTIRGESKPLNFKVNIQEISSEKAVASGSFVFDRTDFGITYRQESEGEEQGWLASLFSKAEKVAKDKIIADEVHIRFNITATAS